MTLRLEPSTPPPDNLAFWRITQRNGQVVALNLLHVGVLVEVPEGTDIVTADGGAFPTSLTLDEAMRQIADLRAGAVPAPDPAAIFLDEPGPEEP